MSAPRTMTDRPPGRLRRAFGLLAGTLGLTSVFVLATATSVLLHLDLGPTRRIATGVVNREVLAKLFKGKLVLDGIDHVGLDGVALSAVDAYDPAGVKVARIDKVRVDFDGISNVRRILRGDLDIVLDRVRIAEVDALAESHDGVFGIADAFTPKPSTEPPPPPPPGPEKPFHFTIQEIAVGHVAGHGAVVPGMTLDADLKDLAAKLAVGPDGVAVDLERATLEERHMIPFPVRGLVDFHLRVGQPEKPDSVKLWTGLAGSVGAAELTARATIEDGVLKAHVDVPKATPEQITAFAPGVVIRDNVVLSADLDGTIPTFSIAANVSLEGKDKNTGKVEITGMLDATDGVHVLADVHATDVELGAVAPVDATPVSVDARVKISLGEDLQLTADARTTPFEIDGNAIPAVDAFAVLSRGAIDGSATIYEEGAPTTAAFHVTPDATVRFLVDTDVASLQAFPRIPGKPVSGSAAVKVAGTFHAGEVDAKVTGSFARIAAAGAVTISRGTLDGHVHGPVAALVVDAGVRGTGLHASNYDFDTFDARATGPVLSPRFAANLSGDKSGKISARGLADAAHAGVTGVELSIQKGDDKMTGRIARIGAAKGGVVVEGVELAGANVGKVGAQLRIDGGELVGKIRGDEVDIARLTNLFGIPIKAKGLANIDVDLTRTPRGRRGHASIELEDGDFGGISGVSALFTANFDDRKVTADGLVRLVAHEKEGEKAPAAGDPQKTAAHAKTDDPCLGAIGRLRIEEGNAELDGPLLDGRTWARAFGSARFSAEEFDLHCLARLGPTALVLSDVKGKLGLRFKFERKKGDRFPSVSNFVARTTQLELAGAIGLGADAPSWESRHVDVQINADFDGQTGRTSGLVALVDDKVIAQLELRASPDVAALIDEPNRRVALLRQMPLRLDFRVPRRSLNDFASLPTFVVAAIPAAVGDLSASLFLDGSLEKPFFSYRLHARGLSTAEDGVAEASAWSLPLDAEITGSYDGEKGTLRAKATHGNKTVLIAHGNVDDARIQDMLDGKDVPWKAEFDAKLDDLPLGEIPFFVDHDVDGKISGRITLAGVHTRPTFHADLKMLGLRVGPDLTFNAAGVSVDVLRAGDAPKTGPDKATAKVAVELATAAGGELKIGADAAVIWQNGVVPLPDPQGSAAFSLLAKRFRLAAAQPAVQGVLGKLDGLLDGEIKVAWKKLANAEDANISADLKLTKGTFHVPQLGQEFAEAHFDLKSAPGGVIKVDNLSADGTRSGRIGGSAEVRLDGLRLKHASANLAVADGKDLPLNLEGVPIGNIRAKVEVTADKDEKNNKLAIQLHIPTLHLELPPSPGRGVQDLDDNGDIKVSHTMHAAAEIVEKSGQKLDMTVKLDDALIEGGILKITLQSARKDPPHIVIEGGETTITGDIHLVRGKLRFFGKEFTIEETAPNIIHMAGDASNPYLNVTARWDAPDGTLVYIDYIGPLQPMTSERIRFRSVPTYSSEQIMSALLLGGDFSSGSSTSQAQQFAGGVAGNAAGSIAAAQFNSLLSGIGPLKGLSTRINTGQDGSLQTSLVYEISDKFSATATVDNGSGTTGSSGGAGGTGGLAVGGYGGTAAAQGTRTQLSVDWHFWRNWLVRGSVILGAEQPTSGVDFLWQYRY